jgi:hypothetical protein
MLGRLANTSLNRFLKKLILADLIEVYSASHGRRRLLKSRMLCAHGPCYITSRANGDCSSSSPWPRHELVRICDSQTIASVSLLLMQPIESDSAPLQYPSKLILCFYSALSCRLRQSTTARSLARRLDVMLGGARMRWSWQHHRPQR